MAFYGTLQTVLAPSLGVQTTRDDYPSVAVEQFVNSEAPVISPARDLTIRLLASRTVSQADAYIVTSHTQGSKVFVIIDTLTDPASLQCILQYGLTSVVSTTAYKVDDRRFIAEFNIATGVPATAKLIVNHLGIKYDCNIKTPFVVPRTREQFSLYVTSAGTLTDKPTTGTTLIASYSTDWTSQPVILAVPQTRTVQRVNYNEQQQVPRSPTTNNNSESDQRNSVVQTIRQAVEQQRRSEETSTRREIVGALFAMKPNIPVRAYRTVRENNA